MNILLINVNIGIGWGGIESHSDTLAAALANRGQTVIMGCRIEGLVGVAGGLSVPARKITVRNSGDLRAVLRIVSVCRKEQIDIVIANGGREYWPAAVAAALAGTRIIFIRHQTDRIRSTTRYLINKHVDRVVAVSRAVRDALLKSGIDGNKISLIHNSVPLGRFDPATAMRDHMRRELGIEGRHIVVGTVSKLHREKGLYETLGAVARLAPKYPLLKLIVVGDGPERDALMQEAMRLSVHDRVIFMGVREDVEQVYGAMDIFVLASTCEEAFGMVLIEAMAMGKPVIGTKVGGIPDIIKEGVNGLLVPPGDITALSCAVERYLDDPSFASTTAAEGRQTVEREFSERMLGERFAELFRGMGLS